MAFDWSTVDGYREEMTSDEKLALLDNYTQPTTEDADTHSQETRQEQVEQSAPTQQEKDVKPKPGFISKRDFDKVSSELAAAKRQLRSKMSEEEAREADRQAEIAAREEELKSLRRDKTLSMHKASFLGLGLNEDLATDAATMLVDGDSDGLFDALKRHQLNYEKALRAKILAETPKPPAGTDPNGEEMKKQDQAKLMRYFGLTP